MVDDLLLSYSVTHVVDGMADNGGEQDFDGVVEQNGDPTPGEILPVSPEVWVEGS